MTLYEQIEAYGLEARGKKHLLRHLDGQKLSRKAAMESHCYQCMGYFIDGRADCGIPTCSLFDYRPFKDAQKPVLSPPAIRRDAVKPPKKEKATDIATKTPKRLKRPSGHSNAILRELESIVGVNKRRK
jgi:hypothetical protein